MCLRGVTLLVSCACIVVRINGMAILESLTPRWISYLPREIKPVYGCFAGKETGKGLQCLADAFGVLLTAEKKEIATQESSSKGRKLQRLQNEAKTEVEIETEYEQDEDDEKINIKKKKKRSSFKEGYRKRKHKTNMMIPAALGLAALIMTAIVAVVGLVAGKALAMSFLAFVMTIALSTKAVESHQRSTLVKEDLSDALAEMSQQLYPDTDLRSIDAIAYTSLRPSDL